MREVLYNLSIDNISITFFFSNNVKLKDQNNVKLKDQ